jgi:hypothetical protein
MITDSDANTINPYGRKGVQVLDPAHGILQANPIASLQNGRPIPGDIQGNLLNGHGHTAPEHLPVRTTNISPKNNIHY